MSKTILDDIAVALLELSIKETDLPVITSVAVAVAELDLLGSDSK